MKVGDKIEYKYSLSPSGEAIARGKIIFYDEKSNEHDKFHCFLVKPDVPLEQMEAQYSASKDTLKLITGYISPRVLDVVEGGVLYIWVSKEEVIKALSAGRIPTKYI